MKKYLFTILVLLFIQVANALPPSIPGFKNRFSDSTVFYTDGVDTIGASVNGISFKRFYNVAWYGAVDDGTTSSYHAFDSALTLAVNDTLGGVVYIPPGSYSIDTPLVKLATLTKRVAVIGSGSNSRIIIDSTGFLKFGTNTEEDGSREWLFADFEIYSNQTGATYGIQLEGGGNVEIRGVNVLGNNNLGTAFRFLATQQGSIKDLYIKQCSTAVYFKDTTMSVTDVNPNMLVINNVSIAGGGETNSLYGVVFNGSQTGVLTNSHITACSTHVSVDYSEGITISNNHFETGRTGVVVNAGSMVNVFNNRFYTVDTSLYLKGGSRHTIIGNLFNTEVILGAGATKSNLMWNLFGNPVVDSNTATNDNRNRYFGNQNQGTGNGYQGLSFNSQTADSLDLWLRSTGDIHVQFDGVESTYVEVYASGVDAPYGFRFDNYAEIAGNTSTQHGLRFYTNNSSNALTERFKIAGAADSVRISISNANKIILPPAVWVGNATDSALITEPFIDSIRANQFGTGGAGETNTLSDTGTYNGTEGFGLAGGKTGTALKVKGLIEGSNVTITASGDSAYSIASSGGSGAWTQQDGNDSLRLIQKNGTDSLIYITADTTNDTVKITSDYTMIIGEEGLTISDSLLIDTILYIVSPGGTDTVFITNVFIDSVRNGDFGGSGSADSAIIDFGSNVYKSSSAKAWSLKFGQALQHTTPTDSSGIDTFTVYVDTNAIALIVEDSLNEYLLTSTASSTYEPLLVNEAGLYSALSDVSNFLQLSDSADGVADGVAQFVTSNGVYDYLVAQGYLTSNETITLSGDVSGSGTTSITTTIGASRVDSAMLNSTEITEYNSDRVGAMVSGNSESGIAVTYQDADNTLDFAVQNVTSSMILNQTIVRADIDTTVSNFVFDDAYKGTSGVPDSILITRRELDDSLDAVRSENAGLYASQSDIGDSLMNYINNSGKVEIDAYRDDSTNTDSAYVTKGYADSVLTNIENPTFIGDLRITGAIDQWNRRQFIDTANIKFYHADAPLDLKLPSSNMVGGNGGDDSTQLIHPSVVYIPQGWNGYKYWLVGTPYPSGGSSAYEDICLYASNDNITWDSGVVSNPLFDEADVAGASYISDGSLFYTDIGQLGIVFRTTHDAAIDTFKLHVSLSSDGTTWSTPVEILEEVAADVIVGTDTTTAIGHPLISPDIWLDTTGQYRMVTVNTGAWLSVSGVDTTLHDELNTLELWESVSPDSGWTYAQDINFTPLEPVFPKYRKTIVGGSGTDTTHYEPWHQSILHVGADEAIMFLLATPIGGSGGDSRLYIGLSHDNGESFTFRNEPIMASEGMPQAWDNDYIYRASGILVEKNNALSIGLYYSAFGYSVGLGAGKERGVGYTEAVWGDTVQQKALVYFNQTYGRGSQSSDSVTLTHETFQGYTAYQWIDSCYDNSTTVYDTVMMTAEIPFYMRAESLIVAGVVSNASTSEIDTYILYAYTAPGSVNDTGTTGGTNVPNVSWLTGGGLRSNGNLDFNNTTLTREAFYIGTSDSSSVYRGGERVALRLILRYSAVDQTVKCGYVMLKGSYLEDNCSEDRADRRRWYK